MSKVTAILSMLHEPAGENSATRLFRRQPVLAWTLQRLWMCNRLDSAAVICWEDQLPAVRNLAEESDTHVLAKHPRVELASIASVAASRRWADGWRGGLLSTCDFDLGFHGAWIGEIIEQLSSDAVILIDPSAGLVDPKILASMIDHAEARENIELCFTQAPPGLGGVFLKPALVQRLAAAQTHPGRILHYQPDQPMRDPIGDEWCAPIAMPVARSTHQFRLDSDRQIERLTEAAISLNGELLKSDGEDLLARLKWTSTCDRLPHEIVLELNTNRATSPIFWPGKACQIHRAPISLDSAAGIFKQLSPDVRLTLSGVGDPLLHEQLFPIIAAAKNHGIEAIHLATDLLPSDPNALNRLVESGIDIVSVHLPAMGPATYEAVMGMDRYGQVIENIQRFIALRQQAQKGVPILAPLFVKCAANLSEMEAWYDQWLRALGAAVIIGPTHFAGLIPDCSLADMSPPQRKPCVRLNSRMTILCDGKVVSCEQDVTGQQIMGDIASQSLSDIWRGGFGPLRKSHKDGCFGNVCSKCREWHRP